MEDPRDCVSMIRITGHIASECSHSNDVSIAMSVMRWVNMKDNCEVVMRIIGDGERINKIMMIVAVQVDG